MKSNAFKGILLVIAFFTCLVQSANAQRYLSERFPDLKVVKITAKRDTENGLTVIWSIQNVGEGTAKLLGANKEPLVTFSLDVSDKSATANQQHNWQQLSSDILLEAGKKELLPGEILDGNFKLDVPAGAWSKLVAIRVGVDSGNQLHEAVRENNWGTSNILR